jgi:hypothetical protein
VERVQPRPGSDDSVVSVRDALGQLAELTCIHKATYIKGSRALVKGDIKDGKDGFLRVVRAVAKAAQRASRRMDIGNFSKGVIDGDFGHICLCCYGEVVAAALCDDAKQVDRVVSELQELVAESLYVDVGGGR